MKKISYLLGASGLLIALLLVGMLAFGANNAPEANAQAGGGTSITGWAWSSNTGWISFNSANAGAGSGAAYSVTVSTTSGSTIGRLRGYAWSSHIGWISFNDADLIGCPDGSVPAINMAATGQDAGKVSGWARVLSVKDGSSGWNGCIQLGGGPGTPNVSPASDTFTASDGKDYLKGGVTYKEETSGNIIRGFLRGFAWTNVVMGWINMDTGSTYGVKVCDNNCNNPGGSPLSGTCTATYGGTTYSRPSAVTLPATGGSVAFTVSNLSGGTGTYVNPTWFKDSGAAGVESASPYTPSAYPANGTEGVDTYSPSVRIADSAGNTGNVLCPQVNVEGVSANLSLLIGKTLATATRSTLSVKKGGAFVLKWENSYLAQGYACQTSVSNSEDWLNFNWGEGSTGNQSFTVDPEAQYKQYLFTLQCTKEGDIKTRTATLNVVTTSVEED